MGGSWKLGSPLPGTVGKYCAQFGNIMEHYWH